MSTDHTLDALGDRTLRFLHDTAAHGENWRGSSGTDRRGAYILAVWAEDLAAKAYAERDAARAEVEQLRRERDEALAFRQRVRDRIESWADDPQTRLEAFGIAAEDLDAARAEAEKVRIDRDDWRQACRQAHANWDAARAEVERLAAAIRDLRDRWQARAGLAEFADALDALLDDHFDATPAAEATPDLIAPNGCRHCGIAEQDHANRWTKDVGWHQWVDPGNEVRKSRMLARRRVEATPDEPAPVDYKVEPLGNGLDVIRREAPEPVSRVHQRCGDWDEEHRPHTWDKPEDDGLRICPGTPVREPMHCGDPSPHSVHSAPWEKVFCPGTRRDPATLGEPCGRCEETGTNCLAHRAIAAAADRADREAASAGTGAAADGEVTA